MSEFVPRTLEVKDKSIDNAVFRGIQEMGLSLDEVEIVTVQEGSKGILGIGAKPYIVRLTERSPNYVLQIDKEEAAPTVPTPETPDKDQHAKNTAQNNFSSAPNRAATRPNTPNPAAPTANTQYNQQGGRAPKRGRPQQPRGKGGSSRAPRPRREEHIRVDNTPYTPYERGVTTCPGADFLVGLLERMEIEAEIGCFESDEAIKFKINTKSMGILIGHRGETLDAMQYLTSLVVNRGAPAYRRVTLDIENYRSKREETLIRLARKIASQVRKTGERVELEPMNPYERRVLHASLQNNPYIETFSEGEEPKRRVIIAPRKGR